MLDKIAKKIHAAAYDRRKAATFHYQVLINADKLRKIDPKEFCRAVKMNESYATEFRKMINLAKLMKDSGANIVFNG